jgi:hypothetical protein
LNAADEEEISKDDEGLVEVGEAAVLKEAGAAAGDSGAPAGLKCRFKGRKSVTDCRPVLSLTNHRWGAGEFAKFALGRPDHMPTMPFMRWPELRRIVARKLFPPVPYSWTSTQVCRKTLAH